MSCQIFQANQMSQIRKRWQTIRLHDRKHYRRTGWRRNHPLLKWQWILFLSSATEKIFTQCLIWNRNWFPSRAPGFTNVFLVVSCCYSFLFFCIMSCARCWRYLWIVIFWLSNIVDCPFGFLYHFVLSFRFSLAFIFSRITTLELSINYSILCFTPIVR